MAINLLYANLNPNSNTGVGSNLRYSATSAYSLSESLIFRVISFTDFFRMEHYFKSRILKAHVMYDKSES